MGSTFFSKRYHPDKSRKRKTRAKSFGSEKEAEAYAKQKGMTGYTVKKLLFNSRKFIVQPDKAPLPVP